MHSPTIVILAAILLVLVTAVLSTVWHFNRNIPGLRLWALSFLCASLFSCLLLVRDRMPEVLSVVLVQAISALAAYLCWLGARRYMGRPALVHWYAAGLVVPLLAMSVYFTAVLPHAGARFFLAGVFSGVCFLLSARTLARGGFRHVPMRYLLAGVMGVHGAWVLVRPLIFRLAPQPDVGLLERLPQWVMLEATVALVLIAFGVLMLANEYVTRELRHLAEVDPLTSVFNRRAFLMSLDKAIHQAQRTEASLAVLVIDLDYFKKINDTCGHQGGDEVLRDIVQISAQCLRQQDVMGRLGGEEFAIFLPGSDGAGARTVAERLRAAVAAQPAATHQGSVALTVSIGLTLCVRGDSSDAALRRADQAMYQAKERGRNRVEFMAQAAA